jgi:hypothetical protein
MMGEKWCGNISSPAPIVHQFNIQYMTTPLCPKRCSSGTPNARVASVYDRESMRYAPREVTVLKSNAEESFSSPPMSRPDTCRIWKSVKVNVRSYDRSCERSAKTGKW